MPQKYWAFYSETSSFCSKSFQFAKNMSWYFGNTWTSFHYASLGMENLNNLKYILDTEWCCPVPTAHLPTKGSHTISVPSGQLTDTDCLQAVEVCWDESCLASAAQPQVLVSSNISPAIPEFLLLTHDSCQELKQSCGLCYFSSSSWSWAELAGEEFSKLHFDLKSVCAAASAL